MSGINQYGFLSSDIAQHVAQHRRDHAELFRLVEQLNEIAQSLHLSAPIRRDDEHALLVALFYCRVVGHIQGVILLAERGMEPQANTLLRAALEASFYIAALLRDPTVLDKLMLDDDRRRRSFIKNCLKLSEDELKSCTLEREELQAILTDIDKQVSASQAREFKISDAAVAGGREALYNTIYAQLCGSVHSRIRDLSKHLVEVHGSFELRWGPNSEDVGTLLHDAFTTLYMATHDVGKHFDATDVGRALTPLHDEFLALDRAGASDPTPP